MRFCPLPTTFSRTSSRSSGFSSGPRRRASTVRSVTLCTDTMRSSWLRICSSTARVPVVTTVMRDRCWACCVSDTVRLSML
jgi:hypothetical protein